MMAGGESPRPGVVDLIAAAKQGNIPVYWVTTTSQSNVDAVLRALHGHVERGDFERIFTIDDVQAAKPDPMVYQLAIEESGLDAAEILAIEDTTENQQAAIAAGLNCQLFPGEYAKVIKGAPLNQLDVSLLG